MLGVVVQGRYQLVLIPAYVPCRLGCARRACEILSILRHCLPSIQVRQFSVNRVHYSIFPLVRRVRIGVWQPAFRLYGLFGYCCQIRQL